MKFIEIDKYSVTGIEDYNGKLSIVLGYEKDGEFKPKWCKQEFGKGNEKNVPVKIPLGDKEKAMEILGFLMEQVDSSDAPDFP